MSKELSPLEALKDLREVKGWNDEELNKRLDIIEKALKNYEILKDYHTAVISNREFDKEYFYKCVKALELLKRNLVIAFAEDNGIDLPNLVVGIKVNKDKLCIIYSTQDKEEIRILKEVLYEKEI